MKRFTILLLVFLLLPLSASALSTDVLFGQINDARERNGEEPLERSPELDRAAEEKVEDLIKIEDLVHTPSSPGSPWKYIIDEGYNYSYAGENLSARFNSEKVVTDGWMNSKSHRENILDEEFTDGGVAILKGIYKGKTANYAVAYFANKKQEEIPVSSSEIHSANVEDEEINEAEQIKMLEEAITILVNLLKVLESR